MGVKVRVGERSGVLVIVGESVTVSVGPPGVLVGVRLGASVARAGGAMPNSFREGAPLVLASAPTWRNRPSHEPDTYPTSSVASRNPASLPRRDVLLSAVSRATAPSGSDIGAAPPPGLDHDMYADIASPKDQAATKRRNEE